MLRTPFWPPITVDSKRIGSFHVKEVPMLDLHELAAGKLAALFGRTASRDLFDVRELLKSTLLDTTKLRTGFVVYGGINRRDWRTISLTEVQTDSVSVTRELIPLLRTHTTPTRQQIALWTERLVRDCRSLLSGVLPLNAKETEFLDHLNERGEIVPELLTDDENLQATVRSHPGLLWKAVNVHKHGGPKPTNESK